MSNSKTDRTDRTDRNLCAAKDGQVKSDKEEQGEKDHVIHCLCNLVAQHGTAQARDVLSLALTCRPLYTALWSPCSPTWRAPSSSRKGVAACLHAMVRAVQTAPPRMLGYSFSLDFDSRYGVALNRGESFFIVKMREGSSVFTINGVRRADLPATHVMQLLWDRVLHAYPHVDVRTTCMYKSPQLVDTAHALRTDLLQNVQAAVLSVGLS